MVCGIFIFFFFFSRRFQQMRLKLTFFNRIKYVSQVGTMMLPQFLG